jgi:hypothetical protein
MPFPTRLGTQFVVSTMRGWLKHTAGIYAWGPLRYAGSGNDRDAAFIKMPHPFVRIRLGFREEPKRDLE